MQIKALLERYGLWRSARMQWFIADSCAANKGVHAGCFVLLQQALKAEGLETPCLMECHSHILHNTIGQVCALFTHGDCVCISVGFTQRPSTSAAIQVYDREAANSVVFCIQNYLTQP